MVVKAQNDASTGGEREHAEEKVQQHTAPALGATITSACSEEMGEQEGGRGGSLRCF